MGQYQRQGSGRGRRPSADGVVRMRRLRMTPAVLLAAVVAIVAVGPAFVAKPADPSAPGRELRFLATADPQYDFAGYVPFREPSVWHDGHGHSETRRDWDEDGTPDYEEADLTLNTIGDLLASGRYRGVVIAGDLVNNAGDSHEGWAEYKYYSEQISRFKHHVYDGLGNHDDGAVSGGQPGPSYSVLDGVQKRERATPLLAKWYDPRPHYSWDWDGVHFVQLNLFATNGQIGNEHGRWALDFLAADLAVYGVGKPIVIVMHYEPTPRIESMTDQMRDDLWRTIEGYNVIAFFVGHDHLSEREGYWVQYFCDTTKYDDRCPSEVPHRIPVFISGAALNSIYLNACITGTRLVVRRERAGGSNAGVSRHTFADRPRADSVLLYRPEGGIGGMFRFNENGTFHDLHRNSGWYSTWSHIVSARWDDCTDNSGLMFYNSSNGTYSMYNVKDGKIAQTSGGTLESGFTHLTTGNFDGSGSDDLITYNKATGRARVILGDDQGALQTVSDPWGFGKAHTWVTGWTHIVSGQFDDNPRTSELFFLNADIGQGRFYGFDYWGSMKSVGSRPVDVLVNRGWTHVVRIASIDGDPYDDLVFYNKSTGDMALARVDGQGSIQTISSRKWHPGYSHLTAGAFGKPGRHTIFLYRDTDGYGVLHELDTQKNLWTWAGLGSYSLVVPGRFDR